MALLDAQYAKPHAKPRHDARHAEPRAFDHALCPVCDGIMRIILVEPRHMTRDDGLERHTYVCDGCENVSRFTVDTTP